MFIQFAKQNAGFDDFFFRSKDVRMVFGFPPSLPNIKRQNSPLQHPYFQGIKLDLGGGFNHLLFSSLFREDSHFD